MIEQLIALALRIRAAVVGGTLLLIGAGAWALSTIHLDAFPDLTPNQVLVMTEAPDCRRSRSRTRSAYPMETAMLGLPRTQGVRSISKAGISVVTVTFEDDVEITSRAPRCSSACRRRPAPPRRATDARPAGDGDGRDLPVPGRVRLGVADGADQRAGIHHPADAAHGAGRCGRERVGRHGAAVSRRRRSASSPDTD